MAVVLLASNGDGLGHLVRVTMVAGALASVGERPVIFSQGIYPLESGTEIPGKCIPSLRKADGWMRRAIAAEVRSMAEISLPSVVVEDTHPNPIALPPWIRRILLVRPPSMEHMTTLRRVFRRMYAGFLLCDHPDSPTWPYSKVESEQILSWREWQMVGPIYREAPQAEITTVRARYGISNEDRVCVFSMGGGGRHLPGDTDAERFVHMAVGMTTWLRKRDRQARAIFVKGPYFPEEARLDTILKTHFEVVSREPQMPALLACAHAAVIRAGFNTPWECMRAGTPFFPFEGTTAGEPVNLRVDRMRSLGLLAGDFEKVWSNDEWRAGFRQTCEKIVRAHPGQPDALLLQNLIVGETGRGPIRGRSAMRCQIGPVAEAKANAIVGEAGPELRVERRFSLPLLITIEEVGSAEPALEWLLELLAGRGLRAALGIVPYLADFDEAFLDGFDPAGRLFAVSQHGYARLPRGVPGTQWREFSLDGVQPVFEELDEIDRGRQRLVRLFPSRWNGGFSAPFDGMSGPLATALWESERSPNNYTHSQSVQGRSLSGHIDSDVVVNCAFVMRTAAESKGVIGNSLPTLVTGVRLCEMDTGGRGRMRFPSRLMLRMRLAKAALAHGYAGIIVTPRALRHRDAQRGFSRILDDLTARGVETLCHAERAAHGDIIRQPGYGRAVYRWALKP